MLEEKDQTGGVSGHNLPRSRPGAARGAFLGELGGALGIVLDIADAPVSAEQGSLPGVPSTLLCNLLTELIDCCGASMACIALYNDRDELRYAAGVAFPPGLPAHMEEMAREPRLAHLLRLTTRPLTVSNVDAEAASVPIARLFASGKAYSLSALPLLAHDQPLGFLVLFHEEGHTYDPEQMRALSLIAGLLARMLAHKQAEILREARENARDRFLSAMSHELRTPLTSILGFAQMMRKRQALEPGSSRVSEQLDVIWSQAQRLSRLIDTFVDMAQIEQGDFALNSAVVEMGEVLRAAFTQAAAQTGGPQRLDMHLPDDPTWVQGDRRRLEQVFTHIIANALRYSPSDQPVSVSLFPDGPDGTVSIKVIDRGPGIPDAMQHSIFERFGRGGALKSGGLGVGLYLSKTIVEAHGGRITVDSSPHRGTEVTILLPR